MAGKRIDARSHKLDEDRARRLSEDRGARKAKMRVKDRDPRLEGLSAKDKARMNAWERS